MGRNHCMTGLILGVALAGTLGTAPLPVRLLVVPVAGGAALLPDIDKPGSRAARSLGPISWALSVAVAALARSVYHATRTGLDSERDNGGHRRLTHTVPGCLLFGVVTGVAVWVHPVAGAVALALLVGLTACGFKALGFGFTALGSAGSWVVVSHFPGWSWLWPLVVAVGSWVHVLGDTVTRSGTPMLWPVTRAGQRWFTVRTPATFVTGGPVEATAVTLALWVSLVVAVGVVTGVLPVAAGLVSAVLRGAR